MREREWRTSERLRMLAEKNAEEEAAALQIKRMELANQERLLEARLWKKADEERRAREAQRKIAAEREKEKAKRYEDAKEKANAEFLAAMRKAKQEAWAS